MIATLNIRKPKLERKLVTMRKMNNVTFDTFQRELRSEKLNSDGLLDSMAWNLDIKLRRVLATLAPEQTQTLLTRPKQPWYTEYIKTQHHVMRNRERVWHRLKTEAPWKACLKKRNMYNRLLIYTKKQVLRDKINDINGDSRQLYEVIMTKKDQS